MIRDVVSHLDYSLCAEISLGIFVALFLLIGGRTLLLPRQQTQRMAEIPLDESEIKTP